jgi:hypothetical protein
MVVAGSVIASDLMTDKLIILNKYSLDKLFWYHY